jgi:hypothetical protein
MKLLVIALLVCVLACSAAPIPEAVALKKLQVSGNTFGDVVTVALNVNMTVQADVQMEVMQVIVELLQEADEEESTPVGSTKLDASPNIDIKKLLKIAQKKILKMKESPEVKTDH